MQTFFLSWNITRLLKEKHDFDTRLHLLFSEF